MQIEDLKTMPSTNKQFLEINNLLHEINILRYKVEEVFQSWRINREKVIRCLRDIAEDLHSMQKHVDRSKLSGSVLGILGGAATIAGFILIPVSGGASLALTVGGSAFGATGGVVSIAASLAEFGITKSRCDEATIKIKEDNKRTSELKYYVEKLVIVQVKLDTICQEEYEELKLIFKMLSGYGVCVGLKDTYLGVKAAMAVKTDAEMAKKAMELNKLSKLFESADFVLEAKNIKQLFQGAAAAPLTKVGKLSVVLGVISIPLDIWSIVTESRKIHKGSKSNAGEKLERIANAFEDEITSVEKVLNSLEL